MKNVYTSCQGPMLFVFQKLAHEREKLESSASSEYFVSADNTSVG